MSLIRECGMRFGIEIVDLTIRMLPDGIDSPSTKEHRGQIKRRRPGETVA